MEERVLLVIKYSKMNIRAFSKECGIAYASLYSCVINRRKINIEMVQKILVRFPEIEEGWLILGRGGIISERTRSVLKNI